MKMKNLVQKDSNMNGHLYFKSVIFWSVFISVVLSIFAIGYVPFCKLDTEQGPDYYPTFDLYIQRAMAYKKKMYLYKGRSFNATCHDGEKLIVHLGWDNCIHAKKGNTEKKIHVQKILNTRWTNKRDSVEREKVPGGGYIIWAYTISADKDTTFNGVRFEDINKNYIVIYKQTDDLPYGRQKYGIDIEIENWKCKSGNDNFFDY